MATSSVTVSVGATFSPVTVKLQTINGDPCGQPDIQVAAGANTVVVMTQDQRILVTIKQ
jgi:hypothetical protein